MVSVLTLSSPWIRREMIEHLLNTLVEILDVLVRFVGKGIACRPAPNQFLRIRIEEVHDQRSHSERAFRCRRVAESVAESASEATPPPPATAEVVVIRIECLVFLRHLHRHDGNVSPRFHFCPAFRSQSGIDGRFDSIYP